MIPLSPTPHRPVVATGRGQANDLGVFDVVECFDPAKGAWRPCAKLSNGRAGLGLCAV